MSYKYNRLIRKVAGRVGFSMRAMCSTRRSSDTTNVFNIKDMGRYV